MTKKVEHTIYTYDRVVGEEVGSYQFDFSYNSLTDITCHASDDPNNLYSIKIREGIEYTVYKKIGGGTVKADSKSIDSLFLAEFNGSKSFKYLTVQRTAPYSQNIVLPRQYDQSKTSTCVDELSGLDQQLTDRVSRLEKMVRDLLSGALPTKPPVESSINVSSGFFPRAVENNSLVDGPIKYQGTDIECLAALSVGEAYKLKLMSCNILFKDVDTTFNLISPEVGDVLSIYSVVGDAIEVRPKKIISGGGGGGNIECTPGFIPLAITTNQIGDSSIMEDELHVEVLNKPITMRHATCDSLSFKSVTGAEDSSTTTFVTMNGSPSNTMAWDINFPTSDYSSSYYSLIIHKQEDGILAVRKSDDVYGGTIGNTAGQDYLTKVNIVNNKVTLINSCLKESATNLNSSKYISAPVIGLGDGTNNMIFGAAHKYGEQQIIWDIDQALLGEYNKASIVMVKEPDGSVRIKLESLVDGKIVFRPPYKENVQVYNPVFSEYTDANNGKAIIEITNEFHVDKRSISNTNLATTIYSSDTYKENYIESDSSGSLTIKVSQHTPEEDPMGFNCYFHYDSIINQLILDIDDKLKDKNFFINIKKYPGLYDGAVMSIPTPSGWYSESETEDIMLGDGMTSFCILHTANKIFIFGSRFISGGIYFIRTPYIANMLLFFEGVYILNQIESNYSNGSPVICANRCIDATDFNNIFISSSSHTANSITINSDGILTITVTPYSITGVGGGFYCNFYKNYDIKSIVLNVDSLLAEKNFFIYVRKYPTTSQENSTVIPIPDGWHSVNDNIELGREYAEFRILHTKDKIFVFESLFYHVGFYLTTPYLANMLLSYGGEKTLQSIPSEVKPYTLVLAENRTVSGTNFSNIICSKIETNISKTNIIYNNALIVSLIKNNGFIYEFNLNILPASGGDIYIKLNINVGDDIDKENSIFIFKIIARSYAGIKTIYIFEAMNFILYTSNLYEKISISNNDDAVLTFLYTNGKIFYLGGGII